MILHYSPSEISKYITGTRLPPVQHADTFIKKSAAYFTDILWEEGKVASLAGIFPVFTTPSEKERLEGFLRHAIRCAYEKSVLETGEFPVTDTRFNMILYGHAEIEDHILIQLSNMFRLGTGNISVWLPFSFLRYLHCPTLPIKREDSSATIHMNVLMRPEDQVDIDTLLQQMTLWRNASGILEIVLWMYNEPTPQPFYFKEGEFLLMVNELMPDNPIAVRVMNPSTLLSFMARRVPQMRKRMSYNLNVPEEAAQARKALVEKMPQCRGAYLFTNTMFLPVAGGDRNTLLKNRGDLLMEILKSFETNPIPVVVSVESIRMFAKNLGFHAPFIGQVNFSESQMEDYLRIMEKGRLAQMENGVILTNMSMPGLSALVFDDEIFLHSAAMNQQDEQLLILPTSILMDTMERFKDMVRHDAASICLEKLAEIVRAHIRHERLKGN